MAGNLGGSWTGSDWLAGGSLDAGEDCTEGPMMSPAAGCQVVSGRVALTGRVREEVGPVEGVVGRV